LASAIAIFWTPVCGRLCDMIPVQRVLAFGGLLVILYAFPFFWLLNTGVPLWIWVALILGTGVLAPLLSVAASPFMARQFATNTRVTGVGVAKESSGAVAAGFGPVMALAFIAASGTESTAAVSGMFILGGILFVFAAWQGRTTAPAVPKADQLLIKKV
jgi:MFS family permease